MCRNYDLGSSVLLGMGLLDPGPYERNSGWQCYFYLQE